MSPTARSLAYLRDLGYHPEVVERTTGPIKKDLWGWADILALKFVPGGASEILAVQTTTAGNMSKRIRKISDSDTIDLVRNCGIQVHVHGWWKPKKTGKWECKVEDLS